MNFTVKVGKALHRTLHAISLFYIYHLISEFWLLHYIVGSCGVVLDQCFLDIS
jgi:hypothetical protein